MYVARRCFAAISSVSSNGGGVWAFGRRRVLLRSETVSCSFILFFFKSECVGGFDEKLIVLRNEAMFCIFIPFSRVGAFASV